MGNFSEIQGSKYYQYDFENKGNKWNVMIVWGKFNHVNITKKSNNPFGSPLGKEFDTLGEAVDNYKDVNIKANILFAGNEAKEFGYNPEYAKGGAIEVGDWVSEIGGKARGQVYKKDGSFIFLKDKYGNEDNTMRFVNKYKHSGKPRYDGGGSTEQLYVAVSEKNGYWYIISRPTSNKETLKMFIDDVPKGETGKIVTLEEAKNHKKVIGEEYLTNKNVYAGGGRSKLYMNGREYREKLNKMTDEELLKYYIDEYGFDPTDKDHAERIENERESVIDELVTEYVNYMKSTGRLYSGGGKTSTNSQVIKKLIKDLDNTPHSVGLALLRERLLSHAEIDLKALEKNPNEWSNPIYSSGMYKDLFTRIIKYLNFESGNGNNDVAVKKLIKNLDNTPYSVGLALLRERLLTYAQNDLKALEKNPKDWSNAFFTSGMYKDLFTRINDHLKFEFKEGGQTIDVTDLGAGDLAFITKTGERVKVIHRIDLIKLAVKNREGKEFAIYEHQLTPIAKAHKKFTGGGNTDSEKNYIKILHDTIRNISEKMEVYGESGYGGYVVYSSNPNQKLNIYNYKELRPYSSQALEPVETQVSFMAPNNTAIIFDNLVKEKFEDRKSYEKYKGLIYIYEPLTNEIAKEILEKLFEKKKFAGGGSISDIKMKVRELEREARGLEPGDPERMRIFSTIAKLKISYPELNRIYSEGGELKKKIVRYPDLDKIQPTMIAKRGAITEQGLFDTYQPVKPTIVSKEPKKKMPGNLTEEISEVDIVRLGVTSLPKGTERKIKSGLDASKILYSVFPKDQIAVQEFYYALFLNNNNDVIAYYNLSKGGITATIADVELLASVSVKLLAKGVITAHNHPSGNLKPSQADIQIAKKTRDALKLLDITMLDSLIIVPNGDQGDIKYTSLTEEGLM
jgi:DNA repair protein RadC